MVESTCTFLTCPVEITDYIIQLAGSTDRHTLACLRLTCRKMATVAFDGFFRTVTYPSYTGIDDLAFIDSRPQVAAVVRFVKLCHTGMSDEWMAFIQSCDKGRPLLGIEWGPGCNMVLSGEYAALLFKPTLSVSSLSFSGQALQWILAEGLTISSLHILSLTCLLADSGDVAKIMDNKAAVPILKEFSYCAESPCARHRLFFHDGLRRTVIRACSRLTVLRLFIFPFEKGHVQDLLDACSSTLTSFTMDVLDEEFHSATHADDEKSSLNLANLTEVRDISLAGDGHHAYFIGQTLATVSSVDILRYVELGFTFGVRRVQWEHVAVGLHNMRQRHPDLYLSVDDKRVRAPEEWLDWMADGILEEHFRIGPVTRLRIEIDMSVCKMNRPVRISNQ